MKVLRKPIRGARTGALVVVLLGLVLGGPDFRLSYAHLGEGTFASITLPGGVAAGRDKVLATHPIGCGSTREIRKFQLVEGTVTSTVFATLPNRGEEECSEDNLAISSGLGGFPLDFVYVLLGRQIKRITPDGATMTNFATVPTPCGPTFGTFQNSLRFDKNGSFGFALLVLCSNGPLWRFDSTGSSTFVADVATLLSLTGPFEGIDVALPHFKPVGGCLLGAAEADTTQIGDDNSAGTVFAVCPNGTGSVVAKWPRAETVTVIPPIVWNCFPNAAFFAARSSDILKFPDTAFVTETGPLNGQALVLSGPGEEGGGIGLLRSVTNPTTGVSSIVVSTFHSGLGPFQGAAFCGFFRLPPGSVEVNPQGFRVTPGTYMITMHSTDVLSAGAINPDTVHAGVFGFEAPALFCVLTEGGTALKCHFDRQASGFQPGTREDTLSVTGRTEDGFCGGDC